MKKMMARQPFILAVLSVSLLGFVSLVKGEDTVRCSFEQDACKWIEEKGKKCWFVSRPTQSMAGMTSYLQFNSSCSEAEIKTRPMKAWFTQGEEEFHFWYYMHGEGEGELSIVDHDSSEETFGAPLHISFNCKGDHGHQWHQAHVKILGLTTYMGIIAKTTGNFVIAVDNITADSLGKPILKKQVCPPRLTTFRRTNTKTTPKVRVATTTTSPAQRETTRIVPSKITTSKITTSRIRTSRIATDVGVYTTMATASEGTKAKNNTIHFAGQTVAKSQKGISSRTSHIVGGCIGGIALLVATVVVGYFAYKRYHLSAMYSFKKKTLDANNDNI